MGLDVGTVRFDYSNPPKGASLKFAWHLLRNHEDADWGFGQGENAMAEYSRESLWEFAESYAESAGLSDSDKAEIDGWIRGLPWRDGHVTLHFGW